MGSFLEHKRQVARKFVFRILLFALVFTTLHFLYILHDKSFCSYTSSGCSGGQIYHEFIHLSRALHPLARNSGHHNQAYQESPYLYLRKALNSDLIKVLTSRDWRSKVDPFSSLFTGLRESGILHTGSKGIGIAPGAVLTLQEFGVSTLGLDFVSSPSLVVEGDMHRIPHPDYFFDFELCNSFDLVTFSEMVCAEMERIVKPGGHVVLHVSEEQLSGKSGVNSLYSVDRLTNLFKDSDIVHVKEVNAPSPGHLIILRKRLQNTELGLTDTCILNGEKRSLLQEAEPLIVEEPVKPWIALKRNSQKIKYLPSMIDISDNHLYFYVDVGARSYHSSIGSWFVKQYPKQSQDFSIYAVEADDTFAVDYLKRKNVKFLPYAAWLRNESLVFGANPENRAAEGGTGMGRIQSLLSLGDNNATGKRFKTVQGFDFADWVINTFTEDDYVVMKMDVEGAEFDLLPRMMETGALCLVDELFLECHYNRWQRSSPLRSTKFGRTYENCLSLFKSLRKNGVLVHQWW